MVDGFESDFWVMDSAVEVDAEIITIFRQTPAQIYVHCRRMSVWSTGFRGRFSLTA